MDENEYVGVSEKLADSDDVSVTESDAEISLVNVCESETVAEFD